VGAAAGVHLPWAEVPDRVRDWTWASCGASPVEVVDALGGFSPGACARLRFAEGPNRFVKAVGASLNPRAPELHRREATVSAALPEHPLLPNLLDVYDDGDWVALLFEELEGSLPVIPWRAAELAVVLEGVAGLHALLTPCPLPDLDPAAVVLSDALGGWARLAPTDRVALLDPWARDNLGRLVALEAPWREAIAGDTLLHGDLRSDNMIVRGERVAFIDWPHAARGAACFDVVAWAPTVALEGGPPPESLLGEHPSLQQAAPEQVTCLVAALAGFFFDHGTRPEEPGLPTLRAFQRAQGEVALEWLRDRIR
jgi:hypothetical protein